MGVARVPPSTTIFHRSAVLVVLAAVLPAAACNSEGAAHRAADPSSSVSGRGGTLAPDPTGVARARALAAFEAMWQDMALASQRADYQSPVLARHASGEALDLVVRSVYSFKLKGQATRGKPVVEGHVTALTPRGEPTTATIDGCADSTNWVEHDAKTLKRSDEPPGGPHRTTATVTLTQGVWKVTMFRVEGTGTC
jgi:hypothetical protein